MAIDKERIQERVRGSTKTKAYIYHTEMNPKLEVHKVYLQTAPIIPEYQRIAFTQLRLVSHQLAIEKGRWLRIPREERLCACGEIQTENHVVSQCIRTDAVRQSARGLEHVHLPDLFDAVDNHAICSLCYRCLHAY
jgi:hypothetical protein